MSAHNTQQDPTNTDQKREKKTYLNDLRAANLCELFAEGLNSGLGYGKVFDIMERQRIDKNVVQQLRICILENGDLLGQAFNRLGILDPASRKLLLVAEQQGTLPETFRKIAVAYNKKYERKKRLISFMVEPMILMILGLIVVRNLMLGGLVEISQRNIDGAPLMKELQPIFVKSGIEALIVIGLFVIFAFLLLNIATDSAMRRITHKFALAIPFFGRSGNLYAFSVFCLYLQQSINAGLNVQRTLKLAAEASNSPKLIKASEKAGAMVEHGGLSLTGALRSTKTFPDDIMENIDLGEETGRLDERLEYLAGRYEKLADQASEATQKSVQYMMRFLIVIIAIGGAMMAALSLLEHFKL